MYPCIESKVPRVPDESIISVVAGGVYLLSARLPPDVELWHVHRWNRLRKHCAEYGGTLWQFLAPVLHYYRVSNLLRAPTLGILVAVMGLSAWR